MCGEAAATGANTNTARGGWTPHLHSAAAASKASGSANTWKHEFLPSTPAVSVNSVQPAAQGVEAAGVEAAGAEGLGVPEPVPVADADAVPVCEAVEVTDAGREGVADAAAVGLGTPRLRDGDVDLVARGETDGLLVMVREGDAVFVAVREGDVVFVKVRVCERVRGGEAEAEAELRAGCMRRAGCTSAQPSTSTMHNTLCGSGALDVSC